MRKLALIGSMALALGIGMAPGAVGAAMAASSSAPQAAAVSTCITRTTGTHVWAATFLKGTLHGSTNVDLSSAYTAGCDHVRVFGVKVGDTVHIRITAKTSAGKVTTIATFIHTITRLTSGSARLAFRLTLTEIHTIRRDATAGDKLVFHLRDGTRTVSALLVKKA